MGWRGHYCRTIGTRMHEYKLTRQTERQTNGGVDSRKPLPWLVGVNAGGHGDGGIVAVFLLQAFYVRKHLPLCLFTRGRHCCLLPPDTMYAGRAKSGPVHGKCSRNGDSLPLPPAQPACWPSPTRLATQTEWLRVHTNSSVHIFPRNFPRRCELGLQS